MHAKMNRLFERLNLREWEERIDAIPSSQNRRSMYGSSPQGLDSA
jgi:hypothetical protein